MSACPICTHSDPGAVLVHLGGVAVTRCINCTGESYSRSPDDAELAKAYCGFDAGELVRKELGPFVRLASDILRTERALIPSPPAGQIRFLDYGCGGGHFVQAARDLGFAATGMELDPESVAAARARGLEVVQGALPDDRDKLRQDGFDFVKCMHVLEHTRHPHAVLKSLGTLLSANGLLAVSVPDQGSFPSRFKIALRSIGIKRGEWGFIQPPIHLHGFSARSMEVAAAAAGLRVIAVRKTSPLDPLAFPATPAYWNGLAPQKLTYQIGRLLGSGGHLTCYLSRPTPGG